MNFVSGRSRLKQKNRCNNFTKPLLHDRVGFLPEETYFFQENGRNMVSSVFFHFLPEEMEEWDL